MTTHTNVISYQNILGENFLVISEAPRSVPFEEVPSLTKPDAYGVRYLIASVHDYNLVEDYREGKFTHPGGAITRIPVKPETHKVEVRYEMCSTLPWRLIFSEKGNTSAFSEISRWFKTENAAVEAAKSIGFNV